MAGFGEHRPGSSPCLPMDMRGEAGSRGRLVCLRAGLCSRFKMQLNLNCSSWTGAGKEYRQKKVPEGKAQGHA